MNAMGDAGKSNGRMNPWMIDGREFSCYEYVLSFFYTLDFRALSLLVRYYSSCLWCGVSRGLSFCFSFAFTPLFFSCFRDWGLFTTNSIQFHGSMEKKGCDVMYIGLGE